MSPALSAPIVVFGNEWGRRVSTMQHLFRHIVLQRRFLWVNAIGHRYPGLPEVEKYRSRMRIAEDNQAFMAEVSQAIQTRTAAEREAGQAWAREHTWDLRANQLLEILEALGGQATRAPALSAS